MFTNRRVYEIYSALANLLKLTYSFFNHIVASRELLFPFYQHCGFWKNRPCYQ
jgi:hypothetical protein